MSLDSVVEVVRRNTTIVLPCRAHDYVLWFRGQGIFNDPASGIGILDFWELKNGELVTITNRYEDLPAWFELHPLEAQNSAVQPMQKKLQSGYEPGEIVEGPNLWRAITGDKIGWVARTRPRQESNDGVSPSSTEQPRGAAQPKTAACKIAGGLR
jgi:hypothetical protein